MFNHTQHATERDIIIFLFSTNKIIYILLQVMLSVDVDSCMYILFELTCYKVNVKVNNIF